MGAALTFLERYHQEGNNFLDQTVTGDGTWVSHIIPVSKHQSLEWHHPHSPSKPKTFPTQKVLATVFGTGKASFWWNLCPKVKPSSLHHIVQH
jgi:hypothetical protein